MSKYIFRVRCRFVETFDVDGEDFTYSYKILQITATCATLAILRTTEQLSASKIKSCDQVRVLPNPMPKSERVRKRWLKEARQRAQHKSLTKK